MSASAPSALIHDRRQLDLLALLADTPHPRPKDPVGGGFRIWCDPASGLMEVVRAGHMPTLPREIGVVGGAA
jgi:hypothetical protein